MYILYRIKTSLHGAQDKVERLETKLAQVLVEKNSKIKNLEDRVSELLSTGVSDLIHTVQYMEKRFSFLE